MDIESNKIKNSELFLLKYIQEKYAILIADEKRQNELEEGLMRSYSPCVSYASPEKEQNDVKMITGIAKDVNKNLSGLNSNKLKKVINDVFYNPEAMRLMACVSDVIFYGINLPPGNSVLHAKIRQYFRKIKQFGSDSVTGYALTGVFGQQEFKRGLSGRNDFLSSVDGLFVIKVPQNPNDNNNLVHEMIVATYGTNKLRNRIPNFAYVYSGMKCSPPWIKIDKEVATFCTPDFNQGRAGQAGTQNFSSGRASSSGFQMIQNQWAGFRQGLTSTPVVKSNNVSYLLYENINPSKTFSSLLKNMTVANFLNYYMQILLSIRMAYLECDFTHYDLHTDNVLIRDLVIDGTKRKVVLTYQTQNGQEYMESDAIATIIDFGTSHIRYKGENYGVYDKIPFSVLPDRGAPLFDAYKFLGFSIFEAYKDNNTSLVQELEKIFRFFNKSEDMLQAIKIQKDSFFALPYTPASNNIDEFIAHVRTECNCSFLSANKPGITVNHVDISPLRGSMGFVSLSRYVGLDKPDIKTIYDLNDYLPYFTNQAEVKTINIESVIFSSQEEAKKLISEYVSSLNNIYTFDLSNPRVTLKYDTMIKYRKQLDYMAEVWDKFSLSKMLVGAIDNVVTSIPLSNNYLDELNKVKQSLSEVITNYTQIFREWQEQLNADNQELDQIIKTPLYQQALLMDSRLSWYDTPRKNFKYVFTD